MGDSPGGANETTRLAGGAGAPAVKPKQLARRIGLMIYQGDAVQAVPLSLGIPIVVGRLSPSDVTVPDQSLSRQHARFTLTDSAVFVEDLGSTNGTRVGDRVVEECELKPGESATLGSITVTIQDLADAHMPHGVCSHDRFLSIFADELERAQHFKRPLTLVMVRSPRGAQRHLSNWHTRIQQQLRRIDRVGFYAEDALELVLPELDAESANKLMRSIALQGEPRLLSGIATFPEAGNSVEELLDASRSALHSASATEPVQTASTPRSALPGEGTCVSRSATMRTVLETIRRVAKGSIPVLIQGETGAGKEVIARLLHDEGPRRDKPLVCVNCAAISANLIESTLFGHEKGAFTGALQRQKGVFEAADGGGVFLDEIGELPESAQAALLRVLETKRFARVGSTQEIAVEVRVIAATHRDLESMVAQGRFREDLLFRLNALSVRVPSLRERRDDIEPLAQHFLQRIRDIDGASVRGIDPEALELLRRYHWPGNVRELKNAVERAATIAQTELITAQDLPERITLTETTTSPAPARQQAMEASGLLASWQRLEGDFRTRMERFESELLIEALRATNWNQTEAAKRLEMPLRTLVYKVRMYGIKKPSA